MAESPESARVVRVVVVSPGDVMAERARLGKVVEELNRSVAQSRGCRLSLWRWESDAHPGLHMEGPQGLIDDAMQIADADVVVGIFWTRFGTPTLDSGSGTEHELRRAWSAWQARGRPHVMVYFCERKSRPKDALEAAQLEQLLSFREGMPKNLLWWPYTKPVDFERAVREHLMAFVLALGSTPPPPQEPEAPTQEPEAPTHEPEAPKYEVFQSDGHTTTAVDVAVKHYDPKTDSVRADIIVAAGSRLPFTTSCDYKTLIDNQGAVYMELLQRSGALSATSDVHLFDPLGHLTVELRPGLRHGTPVRITTAIDAMGRLTAEATYLDSDRAVVKSNLEKGQSVERAVQISIRRERA